MNKTVNIPVKELDAFTKMRMAIAQMDKDMQKLAAELRRPWPQINNGETNG